MEVLGMIQIVQSIHTDSTKYSKPEMPYEFNTSDSSFYPTRERLLRNPYAMLLFLPENVTPKNLSLSPVCDRIVTS